jgi:membrane associated rhomboid family serine protease
MTQAPVGQRCPEHSGRAQGVARVSSGMRRAAYEGGTGVVTRVLIAINVAVYLAELATGAGISASSGWIYEKGVLVSSAFDSHGNLVGVAHGEYWRLLTAAFLHYGPVHLGLNMLALYWFGTPVEQYLGRFRYLLVYLVSGLAGSAGALVLTPNTPTVGASGAIFGIMGAALVLERQGAYVLGGNAIGIILINVVFSFTFSGISIGGHIGGLIGGALCMLALSRFGRGHGAYGRLGAFGIGGVLAVAVASVAIAYFRARGYA